MKVLIKGHVAVGKTWFAQTFLLGAFVLDEYRHKVDRTRLRAFTVAITTDMDTPEHDFDLVLVARRPEGK